MDKIKIVISDLDGTLLNDDGMISEKTMDVIKRLKNRGYLFGFATGRPVPSIGPLMKEWGLSPDMVDAIVGVNGGHIVDYSLKKEETCFPIQGERIKEVIQHFKGYPVGFGVYKEDYFAILGENELAKKMAMVDRIAYKVEDFEDIYQEEQSKLIVICDPNDMEMVAAHGKTFQHPDIRCLKAGKVEYEFQHPELFKSVGVNMFCSWHGLTMDNVLAFGDEDNDIELIRDAGIGVAMKNASEQTKAQADYVTGTNEEDGVAAFLQKYLKL